MNDRPKGIDLFAGAGGMSLGFEQAGFDVVAAVDLDPVVCAVHEYNFQNTATICRNAKDLSAWQIREIAQIFEDLDVVFGGPPCQKFSMTGERSLEDPRNSLVQHFVRLVLELHPKYFVFENVRKLAKGRHAKLLREIVAAFESSGYRIVKPYKVLNAAEFGVPQNRERLFLLGCRRGLQILEYPFATHRLPNTVDSLFEMLESTPTVLEAIGDLPEVEQHPELCESDSVDAQFGAPSLYASRLRQLTDDPGDFSYPRQFDPNRLTSSLRTNHTDSSRRRFASTRPGQTEPVSKFPRLDPKGLCNALRACADAKKGAFTSPRPIHPTSPRCITVREAARLHSYPDWFRFHVTKWHGLRQVGNSVPPLVARAIGRQILQALGIKPFKPRGRIPLGDERLLRFSVSQAADYYKVRDVLGQRTGTRANV